MSTISNIVEVRIANVYGRILYYPENTIAKQLAAFGGGNTFTDDQLRHLHAMGFRVEESKKAAAKLPDFAMMDTYQDNK